MKKILRFGSLILFVLISFVFFTDARGSNWTELSDNILFIREHFALPEQWLSSDIQYIQSIVRFVKEIVFFDL